MSLRVGVSGATVCVFGVLAGVLGTAADVASCCVVETSGDIGPGVELHADLK